MSKAGAIATNTSPRHENTQAPDIFPLLSGDDL